jgi:sigma-B regulation protein RsbU (phosphoserine phosphatase)
VETLEIPGMNAVECTPILTCAAHEARLVDLRRAFAGSGFPTTSHLLDAAELPELNGCRLVVIDGCDRVPAALELCRRLRQRLEGFVPILFVTDDPTPANRIATLEAGADAYLLAPLAPGELLAQGRALLRIKDSHDGLAGRAAEVHRINTRLRQLHQQLDHELKLAQRIQSSLLPQTLPQVPRLRFAVHYLLRDRVGGDFYDVFRLDENHVGLYVADAMGHGVPASLLTIFVKKGVQAKEVFGNQYRLVSPGEVLERLNRDLLGQELPENPFITMVYCLLNHRDGIVQFARAGHPYPLHIPAEGELQLWQQEGLLLGVVDSRFPTRAGRLAPGDKLLLYSDGIDTATFDGLPEGALSLLACAARHRTLPVQEFVAALAHDLFGGRSQPDDLTLLAVALE